jgi:hypothetical protein
MLFIVLEKCFVQSKELIMFKIYAFIIFAKKEFNFKGNSPFPFDPMLNKIFLVPFKGGIIRRKR